MSRNLKARIIANLEKGYYKTIQKQIDIKLPPVLLSQQ